ncbi:unnamed protein product [Arabidopsis halleri]
MWNNPSREWMYNRIDPYTSYVSGEYLAGVEQFIDFTSSHVEVRKSRFYCPCVVCQNSKRMKAATILSHLLSKGFMANYYVWCWCRIPHQKSETNQRLPHSQDKGP